MSLAMAAFLNHHGSGRASSTATLTGRTSPGFGDSAAHLEVLAPLGVTEHLVSEGNRNVALRLHTRGRVLTVPMLDLGLEDTAYPFCSSLPRRDTSGHRDTPSELRPGAPKLLGVGGVTGIGAGRRCCPANMRACHSPHRPV